MNNLENNPQHDSMQHWPLTVNQFVKYAARWHARTEIVSRNERGDIVRINWLKLYDEARCLSDNLKKLGVNPGDKVATLAMNSGNHLTCWYAIMGMGAVCHTLNPRLSDEQLVYIINHADDKIILADSCFEELLERILVKCNNKPEIFYIDESDPWKRLLGDTSDPSDWGEIDELSPAGLCYTSGTTGHPKGVLYTHRSNYLHTMTLIQPNIFNLGVKDVVMPVVPMFHANAWGLTFAAAAVGSKLVLPGIKLDGASLYELLETEGVTFTAGVPTVWQNLLTYMKSNNLKFSSLQRVGIGGSACPESLFDAFHELGVEVQHNWGMTEMSPFGTTSFLNADIAQASRETQYLYKKKQGRVPIGVDMRIVDDGGNELPRDGKTNGYLQVRGHSVISTYFGQTKSALTDDGFFDTGDIATIDVEGFMQITDRAKDIIKSGGEWISSVDMENIVTSHPAVKMAAVIGIPHPKWDERPLLLVTINEYHEILSEDLKDFISQRSAKWEVPDEIIFVDQIPLGATGKIDKKTLREHYVTNWNWPD